MNFETLEKFRGPFKFENCLKKYQESFEEIGASLKFFCKNFELKKFQKV